MEGFGNITNFAEIDANYGLIKKKLDRYAKLKKTDSLPENTLRLYLDQLQKFESILSKEIETTEEKIKQAKKIGKSDIIEDMQIIRIKLSAMYEFFRSHYLRYTILLSDIKKDSANKSSDFGYINSIEELDLYKEHMENTKQLVERYQAYQSSSRLPTIFLDDNLEQAMEESNDFIVQQMEYIETIVYYLDTIYAKDVQIAQLNLLGFSVGHLFPEIFQAQYTIRSLDLKTTSFVGDVTKYMDTGKLFIHDLAGLKNQLNCLKYIEGNYAILDQITAEIASAVAGATDLKQLSVKVAAINNTYDVKLVCTLCAQCDKNTFKNINRYVWKDYKSRDRQNLLAGYVQLTKKLEELNPIIFHHSISKQLPQLYDEIQSYRSTYDQYVNSCRTYSQTYEMPPENDISSLDAQFYTIKGKYVLLSKCMKKYHAQVSRLSSLKEFSSHIGLIDSHLHAYRNKKIDDFLITQGSLQDINSFDQGGGVSLLDKYAGYLADYQDAVSRLQKEKKKLLKEIERLKMVIKSVNNYSYAQGDRITKILSSFEICSFIEGVEQALREYIESVFDASYAKWRMKNVKKRSYYGAMSTQEQNNSSLNAGDILQLMEYLGSDGKNAAVTVNAVGKLANDVLGGFSGKGGGGVFSAGRRGSSGGMSW